jgi:ABC-type multidrug transport system ATPase subunit
VWFFLILFLDYFEKNIEVDSVQKSFDHKSILSDVYLKCETTDIIGLLGRNGSGKSTLLKSSSELKLPILSSSELMVLKQN